MTPTPFDDSRLTDKFWTPEPWDSNIPSPGFISDFVLAFRGIEACTKYQVWAVLHAISALLKRDTWLEWGPLGRFYLNLYVFLVGPPSTKKSSVVLRAEEILEAVPKHLYDEIEVIRKTPNLLHSKATPEALMKFLAPSKRRKNGQDIDLGSNGTIAASELATFLGKQQYNTGLIEILTNLYDCKPSDDVMTLSRGKEVLRDIYVTFIGCSTPSGLSESIPEQAFGDGFLSRVILVYQEHRTRKFPVPRPVTGGPTPTELAQRLAWIAHNAQGPYLLSQETINAYINWYDTFWEAEVSNPDINQRGMSRYDIHLLKLATLIRIQRYEPGNVVELQDFDDAQRLLKATVREGFKATKEVGTTKEDRITQQVMDYIRRKGETTRRTLLTRNSGRGFKSDLVSAAVRELYQRGEVVILKNGNQQTYPTTSGDEIYKWIGGTEE